MGPGGQRRQGDVRRRRLAGHHGRVGQPVLVPALRRIDRVAARIDVRDYVVPWASVVTVAVTGWVPTVAPAMGWLLLASVTRPLIVPVGDFVACHVPLALPPPPMVRVPPQMIPPLQPAWNAPEAVVPVPNVPLSVPDTSVGEARAAVKLPSLPSETLTGVKRHQATADPRDYRHTDLHAEAVHHAGRTDPQREWPVLTRGADPPPVEVWRRGLGVRARFAVLVWSAVTTTAVLLLLYPALAAVTVYDPGVTFAML